MHCKALLLIILLLFELSWGYSRQHCFSKRAKSVKYFFVDGKNLAITIGHGSRVSHQLFSHIFKILVTDVLGYKNVGLIQFEKSSSENTMKILKTLSRCSDSKHCRKERDLSPEITINLEVWLKLGFNIKEGLPDDEILDCGRLGPIGRSGWFVPTYSVQQLWQVGNIILDHWRAFKDPKISSLFDLFEGNNMLTSFTFHNSLNRTYCGEEDCDEDGIFRPPQCRKRSIRCATLLVDYPETALAALKRKISDLELLVNVAWVGENLHDLVQGRIRERKHVLFFHKSPSLLVNLGNFTRISFKECVHSSLDCELDVYEVKKLAWSKIKTNAPRAYHVLQQMAVTSTAYNDILKDYVDKMMKGSTIFDVACDWLHEHDYIWKEWLPDDLNSLTPLYIGGIFPMTGTYWKQSAIVPAAHMAVEAVNQNESILPRHHLNLLVRDGQCVADEVMKSFIHYVSNSTFGAMVGILGPACTDTVEPIAGMSKHFNTVIISYSAEGSVFSDREKYPYFFRTVPENNQFLQVYLKLFQQLNWNRVASISEEGQEYSEYISSLQIMLQSKGINFISNNRFPRERTVYHATSYLQDLKDKNARIIIGEFYDYAARAVMCAAYKMGMTARQGYQWFLPVWFNHNWFDTDSMNLNSRHEYIPCTTDQMQDAINGHMSLAYRSYAKKDATMQENKTVGDWLESYEKIVSLNNDATSQYGGYAYDAVWVYATALHLLFSENDSHEVTLHKRKTTRRLAELLNQTRFSGVSGNLQFIGSSRLSEVLIWQWLKGTKRRQIGTYYPFSKDSGKLELNLSSVVWLTSNGQQPEDGSLIAEPCATHVFSDVFGLSCEVGTGVMLVTVLLIILSLVTFTVIYFKRRYEKRIRRTEARMKELGLMANSRVLALDEWEISRDQVVINRKLGEGAFGTVYGGETFFEETGWIAVAVKTLKIGGKPQSKLEFLSEAELMKRLDHKNITQLVGVCTTSEPVYLVMEFMLYGDLKTFLLERRTLVTSPGREFSDDISDRRLTSMALDIVRGLSYLADLKFVHRDLACRNCLVNSSYTVKIGDFGLCRTIYDSDYYRRRRKDLLPLRWMAPESIRDGLYTTMSDIWSYGVVLFEIITFGSFPYSNLSDKEVLDHVTNCQIINIPNGCKQELKELLRKCWSVIPLQRPRAVEVIEVLCNDPYLIWPCLDEPTASIETECGDSLFEPVHESIAWMWHSKRHFQTHSAENSGAHFISNQSLNTKDESKSGMELKSTCLDISQTSYLCMGPSKRLSKEQIYDRYTSNNLSQVTRL